MRPIALLLALTLSACVVIPLGFIPSNDVDPATATSTPGTRTTVTGPAVTPWPATANCPVPARSAADVPALLALINAERAKEGLGSLALSAPLNEAAQRHACDNAARQTTAHEGSDGSGLDDRYARVGIRARFGAENTGLGFDSPEVALAWWMASPGHRANILSDQVSLIGIGQADGVPRGTWVLDFATPL